MRRCRRAGRSGARRAGCESSRASRRRRSRHGRPERWARLLSLGIALAAASPAAPRWILICSSDLRRMLAGKLTERVEFEPLVRVRTGNMFASVDIRLLSLSARPSLKRLFPAVQGVVANISAWNYPYFIASNVFAAAILTGDVC